VRQRIVNLIAARPDGITRGEIIATVYADDVDGGPDNANTISVLIKYANEELAAQGYHISPGAGPHIASLRCTNCDAHRGWLAHETHSFIVEAIRLVGRPIAPIAIRRGRSGE
jgi:hypothetical protein